MKGLQQYTSQGESGVLCIKELPLGGLGITAVSFLLFTLHEIKMFW